MDDLRITLIQSDLHWEQPQENLGFFRSVIRDLKERTDLILFPETFNTGFSIRPEEFAETSDGPTMEFLREMAREKDCHIMGTFLFREGKRFTNRLVSMGPDGNYQSYDKRHLFRLSEEAQLVSAGSEKIIVSIKGWNILPLTCYDLRFPVWGKNSYKNGKYEYDLLVYLANWPQNRAHVWRTLLVARAMENISFVAGVNRIGPDGQGTPHLGESMVVDPKGMMMIQADANRFKVLQLALSAADLLNFRESFPLGKDWDLFHIEK
jgi:omega-amidase